MSEKDRIAVVSGTSTMTSSIEKADNYTRWVLSVFRKHIRGSMLEVGAGYANYGRHIAGVNRLVSIDVDQKIIDMARSRDPEGNYLVADLAAPDFASMMSGELFDTVMCFNVLEHIGNDAAALKNIESVLREGGRVLLFLPAFDALYNDLDRLAGHYRRYTMKTARALFDGTGLAILEQAYFNPVGGLGWWVNRYRRHDDIDSREVNAQVVFFDRYVLPFSRALNPVTRGFFGQSLIMVGEKR